MVDIHKNYFLYTQGHKFLLVINSLNRIPLCLVVDRSEEPIMSRLCFYDSFPKFLFLFLHCWVI